MDDMLKSPERDPEKLTELLRLQLDRHGEDTAALLEQGLPLSPHVRARLIAGLGLSNVASPGAVSDRDEEVGSKVNIVLGDGAVPDEEFGAPLATTGRASAPPDVDSYPGAALGADMDVAKGEESDEQILKRRFEENRQSVENLANDWNKRGDLLAHDLKALAPQARWEVVDWTNSALMGVIVGNIEFGAELEVILPSYRNTYDFGDELKNLRAFYDFPNITPDSKYRIKIEKPAYRIKYSDTTSKGIISLESVT